MELVESLGNLDKSWRAFVRRRNILARLLFSSGALEILIWEILLFRFDISDENPSWTLLLTGIASFILAYKVFLGIPTVLYLRPFGDRHLSEVANDTLQPILAPHFRIITLHNPGTNPFSLIRATCLVICLGLPLAIIALLLAERLLATVGLEFSTCGCAFFLVHWIWSFVG